MYFILILASDPSWEEKEFAISWWSNLVNIVKESHVINGLKNVCGSHVVLLFCYMMCSFFMSNGLTRHAPLLKTNMQRRPRTSVTENQATNEWVPPLLFGFGNGRLFFFSESFLTPNYVSVLRHSLVGNTVWHQCLPSAEGPQCWGTLETTWERVWAGHSRTPFSRQPKSLVDEDHMQSSIRVPKRMLDHLKKMTQDNPRPQMAGISVWIYPLTSLGVFVCSISESGFL